MCTKHAALLFLILRTHKRYYCAKIVIVIFKRHVLRQTFRILNFTFIETLLYKHPVPVHYSSKRALLRWQEKCYKVTFLISPGYCVRVLY